MPVFSTYRRTRLRPAIPTHGPEHMKSFPNYLLMAARAHLLGPVREMAS